ncbi:origin recognition complex subunit 1 [Dictyostelium discoideum AX4]|uniref:Origin recognition complex subunit 1 n=1 Tax=Dictyostelium discoideum TaxID=44689 RepID=ORC1_DICDI|nr:origin recognition complex subunit 1 [Dictyostelium discoideum AX4]Q54RM2.1 RecName: Full=Origin recognition complex subunit 1; AltName: Full=Origin replication complex subunit A [Dictyostelium discoideum]EAL65980.1 origin recognition complex subunit 1 [Dictyostelium discoideum AX4]|eukprot:XP_639329.1 origin recognition complex subunit 1 [Dictyostelium discoideum AX4]
MTDESSSSISYPPIKKYKKSLKLNNNTNNNNKNNNNHNNRDIVMQPNSTDEESSDNEKIGFSDPENEKINKHKASFKDSNDENNNNSTYYEDTDDDDYEDEDEDENHKIKDESDNSEDFNNHTKNTTDLDEGFKSTVNGSESEEEEEEEEYEEEEEEDEEGKFNLDQYDEFYEDDDDGDDDDDDDENAQDKVEILQIEHQNLDNDNDNDNDYANDNIYTKAKEALHLSAVPDKLPGREKEKATIASFIRAKLKANESGGCLYIAGMPGTGKTATVKEIIKELQAKKKQQGGGGGLNFQFIEINGMQLSDPHQLYHILYNKMQKTRKSLEPKKISSQDALRLIQRNFELKNKKKQFRVILVDEFDSLITKKQTVIYNLFEWPNKPNSKLIIIAIANTMNLPDTLLPRVKSRMGLQKVPFTPYNIEQLETIIKYRLQDLDAFDEESIQICSKRVAAVCGDARRALEICRKAATIANQEYQKKLLIFNNSNNNKSLSGSQKLPIPGPITADHIEEVFEQFSSPLLKKLNQLSFYEKLFLLCICRENQFSNVPEVKYGTISTRMRIITKKINVSCPNPTQLFQLAGNLLGCKFIIIQDDKPINWDHQIKLNLPLEDLSFGLEQDPDLKNLEISNN